MARTLGIAGIQMTVERGRDNTPAMLAHLDRAASLFPWAEVLFFSELCVCGLDPSRATPAPHPSMERFSDWARRHRKWLMPGSYYETDGTRTYNTAVVLAPDGTVAASHRKLFPWRPLEQCAAGDAFTVFDIPSRGRFGLCICYDQWFPEVARTLAWQGAEAVFCPTATVTPDRTQELVMARANAIANQMYWFNLNGTGGGGNGRSAFFDPEGRILQQVGEAEHVMTEIIDLDLVARTRRYGTVGQCQVWKSLRDFAGDFPVYRDERREGPIYRSLGPLTLARRIAE